MNPEHIPEELRAFPQWVCHDAAKRPINPHTGAAASVTDPTTWGTFAQACEAASAGRGVGIGFVFTESDPFAGIDLDVPQGGAPSALQEEIFNTFRSYAERSPSGRGLHIILKGRVPAAIKDRAQGVEVYSSGRYFTVTGDVVCGERPLEMQEALDGLVSRLRPQLELAPAEALAEVPDVSLVSDEQAIAFVRGSEANRRHWDGEGVDDPSKAFAAIVGALARAGCSREQALRLALASPLVVNGPPHSSGTRPEKSARDFARLWPVAARRGAQERQGQAVGVEHGRQIAEGLTVNGRPALAPVQNAGQVPSVDTGWFLASNFACEPVPPRDELVPGVIPMNTVSSITGDGGTGKSTLMRQLANSVATGTAWLGLDVRSGAVIYLSAEDDRDELHRSFRNIGVTQNMGRLHLRSLAGADALLAVPRDRSGVLVPTQLFTELDAKITETGAVAVFIDNAADAFGGNEMTVRRCGSSSVCCVAWPCDTVAPSFCCRTLPSRVWQAAQGPAVRLHGITAFVHGYICRA